MIKTLLNKHVLPDNYCQTLLLTNQKPEEVIGLKDDVKDVAFMVRYFRGIRPTAMLAELDRICESIEANVEWLDKRRNTWVLIWWDNADLSDACEKKMIELQENDVLMYNETLDIFYSYLILPYRKNRTERR